MRWPAWRCLGSRHSLLRPSFAGLRYRRALFRDILAVGLAGSISTVATNLAIAITVALVGAFGAAAIAGYGTASRLEYLLVPLVSGLGLVLYFASQGAGRLKWPVLGNIVRLAVAALGGWLALRWGDGLTQVFAAQAAALVLYGLTNAAAVAGGAWFGPVPWPRRTLRFP